MSYILVIKNLYKSFFLNKKKIEVLKGIDLKIKKGDFIAITGPSGSGKTTFLNLIGGLDKPDKGEIIFKEKNLIQLSEEKLAEYRARKIGFVFQFFNLLPYLTALENVILPQMIIGKVSKKTIKKAKEILSKLNLQGKEDHRPYELSGGEQQRVAIARALINKPELILLDEPTGNLDEDNTKDIFSLLKKLNELENITIIIGTHDLEIKNFCKKVFVLKKGKLYED